MATAKTQRQPEATLDERFLLDPRDPIDALIADYVQLDLSDRFPTAVYQNSLVNEVRKEVPLAARLLIRSHRGLIAAVAHPYKDRGVEHTELLKIGAGGLLKAARYYREDCGDFSDHAVSTMGKYIAKATGSPNEANLENSQDRPMEKVLRHIAKLQITNEGFAKHNKVLDEFSPLQQQILPLLILASHEEIANQIEHPVASVRSAIMRCFTKTETNSTTALALELMRRGLVFNIITPDKPLVETMTDEDFEIANNLQLEYEEIAALIDKTYVYDDIRWKVDSIKRKTGARSRTELAILVKTYDTGERRTSEQISRRNLASLRAKLGVASTQEIEPLLERLIPSQRQTVEARYLTDHADTWKKIGDLFGISENAARVSGRRGIKAMRLSLANL